MSGLHIFCGDDVFTVKERAREFCVSRRGDDFASDPAVEIIDGDSESRKPDDSAALFLGALNTPPFLTPDKFVWLRHLPSMEIFYAKKPSPACRDAAAALLAPPPDYLTVLIDTFELDRRTSFAKQLQESGAEIQVFKAVRQDDRNYAKSRRETLLSLAAAAGITPDGDALDYLSDTLSSDTGAISGEMNKLAAYSGGGRITLADCMAVCSRTPEAVSWELCNAIAARDVRRALELLGVLRAQGEPDMRLLALLSNECQKQLRTVAEMAELKITRVNPRTFDNLDPELKQEFPDNQLLRVHPFRAFKMCESVAGRTPAALAARLSAVRDAGRALVSGGGDSRIILERLVLSLIG